MHLRRLAVVFAALGLLAGACSNEDDDGAASPDTTEAPAEGADTTTTAAAADDGSDSTTTAAPEDTGPFAGLERIDPPTPCPEIPGFDGTTLKVGVLYPASGVRAQSFAASIDGVQARFDVANADDELDGITIEVVPMDDASDPARNLEGARTLIEQEGVYGIVEVSDQSDGSSDYLHDGGVPVTGWHVGRPHWGTQENFFAFRLPGAADPESEHTTRTGQVATELGATKVAIVGGGNQSSVSFVAREIQSMEAAGLEVVYSTTDVVSGNTEFSGVVQRIKEAGADTLLTGMDFLQNTALSQQLTDAGVELKVVIFPGGYDTRVLTLPGMEGATFGLEFKPFELSTPAFQAFDAALAPDKVRNQITFIGWLSGELFLQGLKEAGLECPTREGFIANLRLLEDYTANDAFDPIDFTTFWGEPFLCAYYVRVENQQFVPLFDGEAFCGEPLAIE